MSDFWWQHVKPAEMLLQHAPPQLRQRLTDAYAAAHSTSADNSDSGSDSDSKDTSASAVDARLQSILQSDAELAQLVTQLDAFKPNRVHPYAAEIKARSKALLKSAPKRQFSAAETKRAGIAAIDATIAE
jgi:hypothetical protein